MHRDKRNQMAVTQKKKHIEITVPLVAFNVAIARAKSVCHGDLAS